MILRRFSPLNKRSIQKNIKFIRGNMQGLLPVYENERSILDSYAKTQGLDLGLLLSIRNQIKIQAEVTGHRRDANTIADAFYSQVSSESITTEHIRKFYAGLKQPIHHIVKSITKDPRYQSLSLEDQKCVFQPISDINEIERRSKDLSERFEHKIEKVLSANHIPFLTEREIIEKKLYKITPDILIEDGLNIREEGDQTDGSDHQIKWIDAKNFVYLGDFVPFFKDKMIKQAEKYQKLFGNGALVFRHGVCADYANKRIKGEPIELIPGVMLLDWKQFNP